MGRAANAVGALDRNNPTTNKAAWRRFRMKRPFIGSNNLQGGKATGIVDVSRAGLNGARSASAWVNAAPGH
jgi:hypothetical protein